MGSNTGADPNVPPSLRIDKCESGFAVNGRNCTTSGTEVEYFIRHDNMDSPVLLCYTNVEEGEGGSVAECDLTQQMTMSDGNYVFENLSLISILMMMMMMMLFVL